MSTEPRAIRKKRTSSDAMPSNPVPEGDHRKRRRNRTTQSCLNCHTSKRMCDRKRPCGRCTQLGLTGLCVYEVDDPSQRGDSQDESSRLRKRVAELEGVIRELKNKPHPRWTKSGNSPGGESDKCHEDRRSRSVSADPIAESQPGRSPSFLKNSNADLIKEPLGKQTSSLPDEETLQASILSSSFSPSSTGGHSAPLSALSFSPFLDMPSPPSAPSTDIVTPTEEYPRIPTAVTSDQPLNCDIDLASFFASYPDILACDGGPGGIDHILQGNKDSQRVDSGLIKYSHGRLLDEHCGCLNEVASYNVVLELSLRLRKAADILSHSVNHRFSDVCPLNKRVVDLDAFATTVLGNMITTPNDFGSVHVRSRSSTGLSGPIPASFSQSSCIPPLSAPALSPPSLGGFRSWNVVPCASDPSVSCDESFMTWESSRRG